MTSSSSKHPQAGTIPPCLPWQGFLVVFHSMGFAEAGRKVERGASPKVLLLLVTPVEWIPLEQPAGNLRLCQHCRSPIGSAAPFPRLPGKGTIWGLSSQPRVTWVARHVHRGWPSTFPSDLLYRRDPSNSRWAFLKTSLSILEDLVLSLL